MLIGVGVGLIAAWSLGNLHGKETERRQDSPRQYTESAQSYASRACANLAPAAMFECVRDAEQRSVEAAHNEQDLIAQQDSAFAANVMLGMSAGGTALGFLGLWFVFQTLSETREATRAAIKSAKAGRKANKISARNARAELMPYVFVTKIEFKSVSDKVIYGYVHVQNAGSTPAIVTKSAHGTWVGPAHVLDPAEDAPVPPHNLRAKRILAKEGTDRFTIEIKEGRDKLSDHAWDFYIYGRIEYADVFGQSHWMTYAYTNRAWNLSPETEFVPTPQGNETSYSQRPKA